MVKFTRAHAAVLRDAHWIGGDPTRGEPYGVASLGPAPEGSGLLGLLWLRNPSGKETEASFTIEDVLELTSDAAFPCGSGKRCCGAVRELTLAVAKSPEARPFAALAAPQGLAATIA